MIRQGSPLLDFGEKRELAEIMPGPVIDQLLALPKKRRMEIAERLWLSAVDEAAEVVPAKHKRVVAERLAGYRAGKSKPIPHAELMRRLSAR